MFRYAIALLPIVFVMNSSCAEKQQKKISTEEITTVVSTPRSPDRDERKVAAQQARDELRDDELTEEE